LLFFLGPSATRAAGGGPAHDPRLQEEANVLETRRKSIGPSAHLRRREEKVSWLGDGRRCFSLLFTMWVVADRACNHSPKLSAKDDRRRGVPVHAYLNSSFRFVDFTRAPQRRVTSRSAPSASWHSGGCGSARAPTAGRIWSSRDNADRTRAGSPWPCSAARSRSRRRPACGPNSRSRA